MTERERLIELMKDAETKVQKTLKEKISLDLTEWLGIYADYLLANGAIVPPCKVGDTVYEICERRRSGKWQKVIVERVVHGIEIGIDNILTARCGTTTYVYLSRLGKTVFLTKEEAEKALEELKNE